MLEKVAASDIELEKVVVVRRQWQECSLGFITYIVFVLTSWQERVYRDCFRYMFDGCSTSTDWHMVVVVAILSALKTSRWFSFNTFLRLLTNLRHSRDPSWGLLTMQLMEINILFCQIANSPKSFGYKPATSFDP